MVGMDMGFQGGPQGQAEFAQQRAVAPGLLEHGVDQHRLPAAGIGQQIGVGRRLGVEELAKEDHAAATSMLAPS